MVINMRCKKNCACEECEHFGGQEVMRIENKSLSTLFDKFYNRTVGVSCNNGYRVALTQEDLKRGLEEENYIIIDNEIVLNLN